MNRKIITLADRERVNIKDKANGVSLRGHVEIYKDKSMKEKIHEDHNLIVYVGREIITQKIFNVNRVAPAPGEVGQKDYGIYFLSVGSGGASAADPYSPLVVNNEDLGLVSEIQFTDSYTGNPLYAHNGYKKRLGDKQILQDDLNNNRHIIAKTTTIIGRDECNGNFINEAALWFAPDEDGTTFDGADMVLASRFTFPSIYKTDSLEPIIVWYWFL